MASAFAHAAVSWAMGKTLSSVIHSPRFWLWACFCSILPDLDIIGFVIGVPYEHMLGHRGLTHSVLFALVIGLIVPRFAVPLEVSPGYPYWKLVVFFSCVTMSHGVLDACTDGGLGIAFFAPLDSTRYFFPWRPLRVPPIGIGPFFSSWGLGVLMSELIWVGIPVGVWLGGLWVYKKFPVFQRR